MSMQDTVGDMLTRIRNAQMANKVSVAMPSSKLRKSIADLLVSEGYVASAVVTEQENNKATLTIELKYFEGKAVIETIQRYTVLAYASIAVKTLSLLLNKVWVLLSYQPAKVS